MSCVGDVVERERLRAASHEIGMREVDDRASFAPHRAKLEMNMTLPLTALAANRLDVRKPIFPILRNRTWSRTVLINTLLRTIVACEVNRG